MALYLWYIIIIAFFCVSVTLLIVWLLIQRSKHGRAKAALRTSDERYLLALAGSTDGLCDWNLLSGSVFYSDRYRKILGYSTEEFGGTIDSFRSRLHPEITCARIILDGYEFTTENFIDTNWKQSFSITIHNKQIGTVEVCHLEKKPEFEEGRFLEEEKRHLPLIEKCPIYWELIM